MGSSNRRIQHLHVAVFILFTQSLERGYSDIDIRGDLRGTNREPESQTIQTFVADIGVIG